MVLALSLVESASSWSRFLCRGQKRALQGRKGTSVAGAGSEEGREAARKERGTASGAHLKGREVRGGRRLLEELRGGVQKPRPTAHLRVGSTAAAAAADAGHHRRTTEGFSLVVSRAEPSGAALELWGFCLFGESGGAFC
jgi:hypothetical protein